MNEHDFWAKVWKLIAICFCVTVVSVSGCTAANWNYSNYLMANVPDPIAYACANSGGPQTGQGPCMAYIASLRK